MLNIPNNCFPNYTAYTGKNKQLHHIYNKGTPICLYLTIQYKMVKRKKNKNQGAWNKRYRLKKKTIEDHTVKLTKSNGKCDN